MRYYRVIVAEDCPERRPLCSNRAKTYAKPSNLVDRNGENYVYSGIEI